jgi:ADP-heptose:LPS heptosyltransferase
VKLLIIKPSSLGDIIQALPVAGSWKAHDPTVQIDWVVFDTFAEVLAGNAHVDRLWVLPKRVLRSPRALWSWSQDLRTESYDIVLDLQGLARSALLTRLARATERVGLASAREGAHWVYDRVIADTARSAAERYLQTLEPWGIPRHPHAFGIRPQAPLPSGLVPGGYRVIHPYTRWETKLWPWRHVVSLLAEPDALPWVVVGQGAWFPLFSHRTLDLRNRLGLPELIRVLAEAAAVVSTDSGPAHLAAALGVPTFSLFGPTDPTKTGPVGLRSKILTQPPQCAPCLLRTCPKIESIECMKDITPQRVMAEILTCWG